MGKRIPLDGQIRLIHSLIEFANQKPEQLSEEPFAWALRDSKESIKAHRLQGVLAALAARGSGKVLPLKALHEYSRRYLFALPLMLSVGRLADPREANEVTEALHQSFERVRAQLNPELASAGLLRQFTMRAGHFVLVETNFFVRASQCEAHAMALLMENYQGLLKRLHTCPHSTGSAADLLLLHPLDQVRRIADILADPHVHFFIDDRFEKGPPMTYCNVKHRNAANQRKYRLNIRERQAATKRIAKQVLLREAVDDLLVKYRVKVGKPKAGKRVKQ